MSTDDIITITDIYLASGETVRVTEGLAAVEDKLGDSGAGHIRLQNNKTDLPVTIYCAHVTHLVEKHDRA